MGTQDSNPRHWTDEEVRNVAERSFYAALQWYFTHPQETIIGTNAAAKQHANGIVEEE